MSEELMDGKDILLEEIKQLKELLKGVREERDYLFNKLSNEKLWLQQENTKLKEKIDNADKFRKIMYKQSIPLSKITSEQIDNMPQYWDLFEENTQLKQQLKDKDEKISKVIILLKNPSTIDYEMYGLECSRDIVDIKLLLEILESNKED